MSTLSGQISANLAVTRYQKQQSALITISIRKHTHLILRSVEEGGNVKFWSDTYALGCVEISEWLRCTVQLRR